MSTALSAAAIACDVIAALDSGRQIEPFSARDPSFDFAAAYRAADEIRSRRRARGEKPVGRKIGFTNRSIWAQYRVDRPIWGDVYDTTLHDLAALGGRFVLSHLSEPQIEPEIVFKLSRAPSSTMDDEATLGCIEWVAHGFEIVHSVFPGWRFTAADTVAGCGLHGALLLGRPVAVTGIRDPARALKDFEIALFCDGKPVEQAPGSNVLDSPLAALRHLAAVLAADPLSPHLAAGEIVTTGTVTRAYPVAGGQTWTTVPSGIDLPGLSVTLG
jgi:2-oxo-3-hexenedioate decarboxylase